jgi:hypothetical protein
MSPEATSVLRSMDRLPKMLDDTTRRVLRWDMNRLTRTSGTPYAASAAPQPMQYRAPGFVTAAPQPAHAPLR